jgi:chemotaxis protein histidine kinase CheA
MSVDIFEERLAKVRLRFASTLESKITDAWRVLPGLVGTDPNAAAQVAETYRHMHGICGIGPTVGFSATGKAARSAETILLVPYKIQRGLTESERQLLQKALEALRAAAESELQFISSRGG